MDVANYDRASLRAWGRRAMALFITEGRTGLQPQGGPWSPGRGGRPAPCLWDSREALTPVRARAALCQHTGQSRHGNRRPGSVLEQRGPGLSEGRPGSWEPTPRQPQGWSPHSRARDRKAPPERQTQILNRRAALGIWGDPQGPPPQSGALGSTPKMPRSFPDGWSTRGFGVKSHDY